MKWFWFKFWFYYRLFMSCLQHFNFCLAIYTNCVYFTLWKAYDLLWFWMHLMLCTCFPQLRSENYLLVWCNLIKHKRLYYPGNTYKEIYLKLYGQPGTKSEIALQDIRDKEIQEHEARLSRRRTRKQSRERYARGETVPEEDLEESSSGSSGEDDEMDTVAIRKKKNGYPRIDPIEEEEKEVRKYVYVGTAVEDSNKDLETAAQEKPSSDISEPVAPPRKPRTRTPELGARTNAVESHASNTTPPLLPGATEPGSSRATEETEETDVAQGSGEESDTNSTSKWIEKVPGVPKCIKNRFHKEASIRSTSPPKPERPSWVKPPETFIGRTWGKFRHNFVSIPKFRWSASTEQREYPEIDILRPDFTNTYDILNPKMLAKREKHDRKALTKRLRQREKERLRELAKIERNRKKVADSIELVLALLRVITSFAVLIGNIRRTFVFARISYVRPGNYNLYLLQMIFSVTTSIDVTMFLMNCMWIWCCQWNVLLCRLGFIRFWCLLLLFSVTSISMIWPMSRVMDDLEDASWCRFKNGSELAKYQPRWHMT
ncbi:unnamed protein product, partial [Mesorhabditis belari]|uniref:Uncharacterized protein n=1 Tax=Mesorhabditis belari TaxID=2138241 RepID=A0AAF3J585_9BILA